jgi:hypothetical protein
MPVFVGELPDEAHCAVHTHDDGMEVVGMDESECVVLNGRPEFVVSSISSALRTTATEWLARLGARRRVTELARISSALAALQIIMTTDTKERKPSTPLSLVWSMRRLSCAFPSPFFPANRERHRASKPRHLHVHHF